MDFVGHYQLLGEIARGGMGVVYRAQDPSGRVVAVKVLLDHDPDSIERFQREAQLAHQLTHPHVVRVQAYGVARGRPYLVMDYVEGEDLFARIKRDGPFPEVEARRVFLDLGQGLRAAHVLGIVHRDLKPQNVLLRGAEVFLTDFGLARRGPSTLTATGELLGTPAYMAPEQATGERGALGSASDVYGFGATLYAALCGSAPHEGASLFATLDAVLTAAPPPLGPRCPAPISRDLETLVSECLRKDPRERPALEDVLQRLEAARPAEARGVLLAVAGVAVTLILALTLVGISLSGGAADLGRVPPEVAQFASPEGLSPQAPSLSPPEAPSPSPGPRSSEAPRASSRAPESPGNARAQACFNHARRAEEKLLWGEARALAEKAVSYEPRHVGARLLLIRLAFQAGKWTELEELVSQLGEEVSSSDMAEARYFQGRARHWRSFDVGPQASEALRAEALALFLDSLRAAPSARCWAWLGRAQVDLTEAESCLQAALRLPGAGADVVLLKHDLAPRPASLERDPSREGPHMNFDLGLLLLRYQVVRGAELSSPGVRDLLTDLRRRRPQDERLIAQSLGFALLVRGGPKKRRADLREALGHFSRAVQEAPRGSVRRASILGGRGECYVRLGDRARGILDLKASYKILPQDSLRSFLSAAVQVQVASRLGHWNTQELREQLEFSGEVVASLERAAPAAEAGQAHLEGFLAAMECRFEDAERKFARAIALTVPPGGDPLKLQGRARRDVAAFYLGLGRSRLLAGALGCRAQAAVPALERSLEIHPNGSAQAWLAHACAQSDPARAAQLGREIMAGSDDSARALVRVLVASEAEGRSALDDFFRIEPGNPRLLGLGCEQDPERTAARLARASRAVREHPLLVLARSRVTRRSGQATRGELEASAEALGKVLEGLPEAAFVRAERGALRGLQGKLLSARADLERANRDYSDPRLVSMLAEFRREHPEQR